MSMFQIYGRVISMLAPERTLTIMLVIANLILAAIMLVEPWLFGHVIDSLGAGSRSGTWFYIGAWTGSGLCGIIAGVAVSLQADRLAHRRRLAETTARAAEAHDFIVVKPEGYATLVAERGRSLSGGERQRLAIARATLKDAPIQILDEATSALDNAKEARIQRALATLTHGRTTFVIAHRLTTVREADQILVLKDGRLVEQGRYDELVRRGGLFAELNSQGTFKADDEADTAAA